MNLKYYAKRRTKINSNFIKKKWKIYKITKYIKKKQKILDIGCATGDLSEIISKRIKYFGIDYNENFVEYCIKNKKLDVKQCDVSTGKLPFEDNFFDFIYCSHVIEHINTKEQLNFMKELSRICKKNAIIFILAPTPYHWYFWDDETHIRPCTHGQLAKLAKNFQFKIIENKYSLTRFFPNNFQKILRLPPLRWFLWETYLIAKKK